VAEVLDPVQRRRLESRRQAFIEFLSGARLVQSHLDFNVANFIGDEPGRLLLLDIADAGLVLPGTYDVNNLLLNEVHRGRSTHLLRSTLADPVAAGLSYLVQATIGRATDEDVRTSMLVNLVLRESQMVALPLLGHWDPRKVRRAWDLFLAAAP